MANVIIVGMQCGDEGKGKIVDLLCPAFDGVVRYQGGHNAGHTVKFRDQHFSLRLIPSGILHEGMSCVMGNGMVVAPDAFLEEIAQLEAMGVVTGNRLFVSNRAHALLSCHALLDQAREEARGTMRIGTTSRGIGPAYAAKASRYGIRLCDLFAPDLPELLALELDRIQAELTHLKGGELPSLDSYLEQIAGWRPRLQKHLADTEQLLNRWISDGKCLLFEGAQGTLLDIDHGTYPFVTSSNSTAGGACTGTGVPPTRIDGAIGVLKAYTTRVGGGPFPGELTDSLGEFLRKRGNEFGTVTGRPRRCGWLDTVVARYARLLNGIDTIALTKLDVLDELDEISVCVAYRVKGEVVRDLPPDRNSLEIAVPIFRTFPGWKCSTVGIVDDATLPKAARTYVDFIAEELNAPISLLSTGPRREETLVHADDVLRRLTSDRLPQIIAQR
jgi:adenylosuccinate synthase